MSIFNSNQRTSEHNRGEKFSEGVIMEYKIAAGYMSGSDDDIILLLCAIGGGALSSTCDD